MNRKEKSKAAASGMALVHPNAAAIDIGATMHMAAVGADRASNPVRCFGTFTGDLHRLADWFAECGITTIVMESTSVYWIPIYELLEERGFEVFLVNARDAKHVPGRKTDIADAARAQGTFFAPGMWPPRSTPSCGYSGMCVRSPENSCGLRTSIIGRPAFM